MVEMFSFPTDQYLLIGRVGKAHGLHGEVKLHLFSGQPENVTGYSHLILVSTAGTLSAPYRIATCRVQGKTAIAGLELVEDRNHAEQLQGMGILITKEDLPQGMEGDSFWYQYYNLPVRTADGRLLGHVEKIFSNGAQDILVVQGGGHEYLIPILDSIVVRRTDKELIIAPPPGLLEINSGLDDGGED
jgi:16S rRNA processing protein RimM